MKKSTFISFLFLAIIIAGTVLYFRGERTPDFLKTPSPNGYQTFLRASKDLGDVMPSSLTNNLGQFVAGHSNLYYQFSLGLTQSCEAPPEFYIASQMPFKDLMQFRRLADAVYLKSKIAIENEQFGEAADNILLILRFGQKVEVGPLINFMMGSGVELYAKKLEPLIHSLTPEELKNVAGEIRSLNKSRVSFKEIERRERYFASQNRGSPLQYLKSLIRRDLKEALKGGKERYLNVTAYFEVLATTMDLRRYSLLEGRIAKSFADLIPHYAPVLPLDPYTGQPLILANKGSNVVVYSVGPNLQDDSGGKDDIDAGYKDQVGGRMVVEALKRAGD